MRRLRKWALPFVAVLAILGYASTALGASTPTTTIQPSSGPLQDPVEVMTLTRTGNTVHAWAGLNNMRSNQEGHLRVEVAYAYTDIFGVDNGPLALVDHTANPGDFLIDSHDQKVYPGRMVDLGSFELLKEPTPGKTLLAYFDGGDPDLGQTMFTYVYTTPILRGGSPPDWFDRSTDPYPATLVIPSPSSDGSTVTTPPVSQPTPPTTTAPQPTTSKPAPAAKKAKATCRAPYRGHIVRGGKRVTAILRNCIRKAKNGYPTFRQAKIFIPRKGKVPAHFTGWITLPR